MIIKVLIILSCMVLAFFMCRFVGIRIEKRLFNGGICIYCDGKLKLFDYDSHGGRGYKCQRCRQTIWISYDEVDDGGKR